ncbi:MAG TPA: c-type cytochrome [Caulobacteraceae bacterium]|nr:c-type cytochrome [Caulobacteraceae bacterium]
MRSIRLAALGAATAMIALATTASAQDAGSEVYQERCSQCHVLNGVGQGPSLIGVVGRKAASLPGYPFSAALKKSGLSWTPANLDAFLESPTKLVPGTAMRAVVADAAERKSLVAYLATLKR